MIVIKNVFGGSKVYIKSIYNDVETVIIYNGGEPVTSGGGGVTDHGDLTGLGDDDHTQYHNDSRGDARYEPIKGADDNFVTDAEKVKLSNLSGTNTGDQDLSGKANVSHTHAQSDITNLVTDLAGKAASSHTHAQSDITNLTTDLAAKVAGNGAITGATKTKITYDSKGLVTAGADIAAADLPTGIDAAKINTGVVSNTEFNYLDGVTSAIQTQIDSKQATLVSGTNLRTVNGNTLLGSTNIATYSDEFSVLTGLGWTSKAQTFDMQLLTATSYTLIDRTPEFFSVYLREAATLTGVGWLQVVNGSYTANNYNGVGLYTYSGGTMTLVASSTNDGNCWQQGGTGYKQKAFSSTYAAAQGVYYIGMLYCRSAAVTAPTFGNIAAYPNTLTNTPFTNSAKLSVTLSTQTSLISSQAMSGATNNLSKVWLTLY